MDFVGIAGTLVKALWDLKVMYDQHKVNKSEVTELHNFIQDLQQYSPDLEKRLKEGGGNHLAKIMLQKLATDISEAIDKVDKWSTDKSFFRILNASDRKLELENMHIKVMSSILKNLQIAHLSVLLDVRASQATILEQQTEMSILIGSIRSVQGSLLPEVRAKVVEATRSPFADEKFWQEVLAAVDSRHDASVSRDQRDLYEDPVTAVLMIDPIVASNGHTYCRWTIIDNDMKKNPLNPEEDMAIVVDNLTIRRGLFDAFPEQYAEFQQRRHQYRCNALALVSNGFLGDAEVALQNVIKWDKNDKQCYEALVQVQEALRKAKEKSAQSSSFSTDQLVFPTSSTISRFIPSNPLEESSSAIKKEMMDVENNIEEPTVLNTSMCSKYLVVSADKLTATYKRYYINGRDAGAIQANRPAPCHPLFYYFEMTVKDGGQKGMIGIGFTDKQYFKHSSQPGWKPNSYGYHGDDGKLYCAQIFGKRYGPRFTTGDVVGAGINYAKDEIFFTKNGTLLPSVHKDVKVLLYPTIGLQSPDEKVEVNFGQQKFTFNVETLIFLKQGC